MIKDGDDNNDGSDYYNVLYSDDAANHDESDVSNDDDLMMVSTLIMMMTVILTEQPDPLPLTQSRGTFHSSDQWLKSPEREKKRNVTKLSEQTS